MLFVVCGDKGRAGTVVDVVSLQVAPVIIEVVETVKVVAVAVASSSCNTVSVKGLQAVSRCGKGRASRLSGWWFGTRLLFFHSVGNVIIPTDEVIFFRVVGSTTNQLFNGYLIWLVVSNIFVFHNIWENPSH